MSTRLKPLVAAVLCVLATSAAGETVRFATFNASLNRNASGQLLSDLAAPGIVDFSANWSSSVAGLSVEQRRVLQAHYVAEILQRVQADVLLVNEFDHDFSGVAGANSTANPLGYSSTAAQRFQDNFLAVPHGGGATGRGATEAISYAYRYTPNTNTGVPSGFDLNNNGVIAGGDDAFGFGTFSGQFGFTIYSKYEIVDVRTFQNFLWKDMPGNLLTNDPTANPLSGPGGFYSPAEVDVLRLSSKNHAAVTLLVEGREVHFLTAHPTPPVFDGAEDRNGKRNHDEIRFWADYVAGGAQAGYIYDDQGGFGGLAAGAKFVIAGDYNADPLDGDSFKGLIGGTQYDAIGQLLDHPLIADPRQSSAGGTAAATDPSNNGPANQSHLGDSALDTADFNDAAPGNLRVDYVLPSANLEVTGAGIYWPTRSDAEFPLVGTFNNQNLFSGLPTSDHKAVWVDVEIAPIPEPGTYALMGIGLGLLGWTARRRQR
jgi:hypothetical protein